MGPRAASQRLAEWMGAETMRGAQGRGEIDQPGPEAGPAGWRLERHLPDEAAIVVERAVAWVVHQPPGGRQPRQRALVVGRLGQQRLRQPGRGTRAAEPEMGVGEGERRL